MNKINMTLNNYFNKKCILMIQNIRMMEYNYRKSDRIQIGSGWGDSSRFDYA